MLSVSEKMDSSQQKGMRVLPAEFGHRLLVQFSGLSMDLTAGKQSHAVRPA